MIRRKVRTKRKGITSKPSTKKSSKTLIKGAEGFATAKKERAAQEANWQRMKDTPYDFRIKPGEQAELVLLDEVPFFTRFHSWKQGRDFHNELCIADSGENCPLCQALSKQGTYTLVISAIDKRSYKNREGKVINRSKKLVKAMSKNIGKFERMYEKYGTFRGLVVQFARDGDKEARIGEDIQCDGTKLSEIKLRKFKELAKVPDYEKIFAPPSAAELRTRHKLDSPIGSEDAADDEDLNEEAPW